MCDGNEQGMVSRASRTQNERKQTKKKRQQHHRNKIAGK